MIKGYHTRKGRKDVYKRQVAYWVVIEHFMTGGGVMLLVAVLLGIVGTILFIRGIARLLSIVAASNKRKATTVSYTHLRGDKPPE